MMMMMTTITTLTMLWKRVLKRLSESQLNLELDGEEDDIFLTDLDALVKLNWLPKEVKNCLVLLFSQYEWHNIQKLRFPVKFLQH